MTTSRYTSNKSDAFSHFIWLNFIKIHWTNRKKLTFDMNIIDSVLKISCIFLYVRISTKLAQLVRYNNYRGYTKPSIMQEICSLTKILSIFVYCFFIQETQNSLIHVNFSMRSKDKTSQKKSKDNKMYFQCLCQDVMRLSNVGGINSTSIPLLEQLEKNGTENDTQ